MSAMKTEIWKEIDFTNGVYAISNIGRLKRLVDRGKYRANQILKPCIDQTGYVKQVLCFDGKRLSKNIHTLVCHAFICKRPNNMCVNHKNGVKSDNRLENLEYVTYSQNVLDGIKRTGWGRGERHNKAKLFEYQIKEIRNHTYKRGDYKVLAQRYGVHRSLIGLIIKNKIWTHIK